MSHPYSMMIPTCTNACLNIVESLACNIKGWHALFPAMSLFPVNDKSSKHHGPRAALRTGGPKEAPGDRSAKRAASRATNSVIERVPRPGPAQPSEQEARRRLQTTRDQKDECPATWGPAQPSEQEAPRRLRATAAQSAPHVGE
eukprot:12080504-Alexandrium_andersonii.AAC.2